MRICRQGKKYHEFFSDSVYGGKKKSKDAAMARYAELDGELPAPGSTRDQLTSRNTTGQVGVYVAVSSDRKSGQKYEAYCAGWTDPDGTRRKINFAWEKYGEKKAWDLACFSRQNMIHSRAEVIKQFEAAGSPTQPRKKK